MKRHAIEWAVVLLLATQCPAQDQSDHPADEVDVGTQEVLEKINAASAYEVPDLGLKRDSSYARTTSEMEPFRHVKPYRQHFLLQQEYTGPGRTIPEPEHVDTVKLGFIGPIESTISVATGGQSHEETLGVKMLQGARLAIEQIKNL